MAVILSGPIYRRKVSSRGQTVLPPEVRVDLGVRPGDEVVFEKVDGRWVIRPGFSSDDPFRAAIGALRDRARVRMPSTELLDEIRGPVERE